MQEITLKKLHEDCRGVISSFKYKGKEVIFISFVKYAARGGHCHSCDNDHFVLHGSLLYKETDLKNPDEEIKKVLVAGDRANVKAGMPHLLIAREESLIVENKKIDSETTNYEPYRKIVDEFIKRHAEDDLENKEITMKKINGDNRGYLQLVEFGDKEFLVSFSFKGAPRGGYYHDVERWHLVLDGSFLFKEVVDGKESERVIKTGDLVAVKPGIPHIFIALEDTLMIEFSKEKCVMTKYESYRKIVDEFFKN